MSVGALLSRLRRRKVGRLLALDFDGRRLRMVLADVSGGRTRINRLLTADLPDDLDEDDPQAIGAFLGQTLQRLRLAGVPVVMNVPRAKAVFKPLVLPPVDDEAELASMARFQAQKELTFKPEEAVIDFAVEAHYGVEPTPAEEPAGQHVLAAAVQNSVVAYYQQMAEAAGVRLLRLGLRPYANMRGAEEYAHGEEGRVTVVHLTGGEAEIEVIEQGGLTFSRSADITLPDTDAEAASRASALADVVQEIARSVQSYLAVEGTRRIDRVLVAGGTGFESTVAEALGGRLRTPWEVFDPSPRLRLRDVPADASAFLSALGLAEGQGDAEAHPFDFLNPKQPAARRDPTRTIAAAAAAAVALIVVSAFAGAAIHLYRARAEVAAREEELRRIKEDSKDTRLLAQRVKTLEEWLASRRDWLDHWAYLSATVPPCEDVYVTSLKTGDHGTVSLNVKARSSDAVDALGARLSEARYGFKPGQVTTTKDRYGYNYVTSAKVIAAPDMEVNLDGTGRATRPQDDVSAQAFTAEPRPASRSRTDEREERPEQASESKPPPQTDRKGESESDRKGESESERRAAYEAWMRERNELMKNRPDKNENPEAYEAWQQKMRKLHERHPRRRRGDRRSDTRYPDARY
ncbi:MAG: pilus assembly protein PilM [Phycisphaerae bacterium]